MYDIKITGENPIELQLDYFSVLHISDYDIKGASIQFRNTHDLYPLRSLLLYHQKYISDLIGSLISHPENRIPGKTTPPKIKLKIEKKGHKIVNKKINALYLIGAKNETPVKIFRSLISFSNYTFFENAMEKMANECDTVLKLLPLDLKHLHMDTEVSAEDFLTKIRKISNG